MNKGITFRMGQTHVPRYTKPLLEKIQADAIDDQGGAQAIVDCTWRRRSINVPRSRW